jgi:hypothetical protein
MDDVVQREHERACRVVRREEGGVAPHEQRERVSAEPADDGVGRRVDRGGGDADETHQLAVGIASQGRVGALELSCLEELVPGVLSVLPRDDLLEELEDDALHSTLSAEGAR